MKFSVKKLLSLALLASLGIGIVSCNKDKESIRYIPVQPTEGGSWVFINEKGEVIGKQQWEFEPSMTKGNIFVTRNDSSLAIYQWDKDVAKPIDSLQNLVSVGVLNDGLIPVTPHMQRIRIVDPKGKLKFVLDPINGKEISSCANQFSEGLLIVNTIDDKAGVINTKGEVIVQPRFSEISNFSGGYALAADYNYDDYEEGPKYYIVDKEGNISPVKGKFGYGEGDGFYLPQFEDGMAIVNGAMDTTNYTSKTCIIHTDGKVTEKDNYTYYQILPDGGKIVREYGENLSSESWVSPEDKVIRKAPENASLYAFGNYVTEKYDDNLTIYNLEGKKLNTINGNVSAYWSGGKFGLFTIDYGQDYSSPTYTLYDPEGKAIPHATYYGVGIKETLSLSDYEDYEEGMEDNRVTSAYVDVTAAASKLVDMITNGVKGKDTYWLGQSVANIFAGENAKYFSYMGRNFSIPTGSDYYLATGSGFRITGQGQSNIDIVAPTYQKYFEVHHYDYWGRAWGWNRTRQVGVHFDQNAKVICFDLTLSTNHPSGMILREAIARRLKQKGFTETSNNDNYEEFTDGNKNVIIYGNKNTDGVGAIIYNKDSYYYISDTDKAALAAKL